MPRVDPKVECPHCKRRHFDNPILNAGDPVRSLKYGAGTITRVNPRGSGCLDATILVQGTGKTVGWFGDGNWFLANETPLALPPELEEWPTTRLLTVFVRLQDADGRKGLAWRAATRAERTDFWEALKNEIDARIPRRRRFDASDEPDSFEREVAGK